MNKLIMSLQEKNVNRIYFDKKSKIKFIKKRYCGSIILIKKYHNIHKIVYLVLDYLPKVLCAIINDYVDDIINVGITNRYNNIFYKSYEIYIHNTYINGTNIEEEYNVLWYHSEQLSNIYCNSSLLIQNRNISSIGPVLSNFMETIYNKYQYLGIIDKDLFTFKGNSVMHNDYIMYTITNKKLLKNVIVILKMILDLITKN
jgi:hypothetical protein